jgi:hypothetical protein
VTTARQAGWAMTIYLDRSLIDQLVPALPVGQGSGYRRATEVGGGDDARFHQARQLPGAHQSGNS